MQGPRQFAPAFLALIIACGAAACESRPERAADTESASAMAQGDTAPAGETGFSLITAITGFSTPEAARYDGEQDVWFVSNINGAPAAADNNGFISRMRSDGRIDSLHFIQGGRGGVTLNAPKGLLLVGDTLWVADITVARAFNARTGAPIASVTVRGATMLNDLAVGPDGAIYITDTGLEFGVENAQRQPSRIYRVASGRASLALESERMNGPNGIAWDGSRNAFVIGSFFGDSLLAWAPGESVVRALAGGAGQWDGIAVLADGRVLASSWADSSLYVMQGDALRKALAGVASPAAIGVDPQRMQVAIPALTVNQVNLFRIPE